MLLAAAIFKIAKFHAGIGRAFFGGGHQQKTGLVAVTGNAFAVSVEIGQQNERCWILLADGFPQPGRGHAGISRAGRTAQITLRHRQFLGTVVEWGWGRRLLDGLQLGSWSDGIFGSAFRPR